MFVFFNQNILIVSGLLSPANRQFYLQLPYSLGEQCDGGRRQALPYGNKAARIHTPAVIKIQDATLTFVLGSGQKQLERCKKQNHVNFNRLHEANTTVVITSFFSVTDRIFFLTTEKKLSQFGQNVRKYELVNTVTPSFYETNDRNVSAEKNSVTKSKAKTPATTKLNQPLVWQNVAHRRGDNWQIGQIDVQEVAAYRFQGCLWHRRNYWT